MMYHHLMVPIDDTALSAANVSAAVTLAQRLAAQITFFHAAVDLAATGDGALLMTVDPRLFSKAAVGATNAVLSKAVASAAAAGVMCETASSTSDHPAEAIVKTALACGCDLIVMGSRGVRGVSRLLHGSQTERVLRQAPIALLVTRVASNDPLTPRERAIGVIEDEHRSIAVTIRGMQDLVERAAKPGGTLDRSSLEAMLSYLQAFPLQTHHPKEERYLHRWLLERAPECKPMLEELEAQHAREHSLVDALLSSLKSIESDNPHVLRALAQHAHRLAEAVWQHLDFEERTVLPLARRRLDESDWIEIADAFEANEGPGFGSLTSEEFRRLFTHIANLVPQRAAS